VPADRLRRYAEAWLLPRRSAAATGSATRRARHTVRLLAGVEDIGIGGTDLAGLAAAWHRDDCAVAQAASATRSPPGSTPWSTTWPSNSVTPPGRLPRQGRAVEVSTADGQHATTLRAPRMPGF
jgi:hypothetical protein